ncbi:MAG: hypothetical protein V4850_01050 [Myxococcota bacterium]
MDAPLEWHASAGGQIDSDSHGDVNLGLRTGAWSFVLRTDAPEITWAPSDERGRAWVTARGHAFAAGLFISPWADGAPDPEQALRAASVGAEAGWVGYGPAGIYAGGRAAIDGVFFGEQPSTTVAVPDARAVVTMDAIAGLWRPGFSAWARAGVDFIAVDGRGVRAPHLVGELHWLPALHVGTVALAPRVEAWAGVADAQDDLLHARIGGLNPWVVPLAGAAWAEWWAEDYAAVRIGPTVGVGEPGAGTLGVRVSPFVDLATFGGGTGDSGSAAGVGLGVRAWRGRLFADVTGGYAPWIERQTGISRASVWVSLGWDWGTKAGPTSEAAPGPMGTYWPG